MSYTPSPGTYPAPVAPARAPRQALGLPAGSVRAILALAVLGLLWLIVLRPLFGQPAPLGEFKLPLVFVYLQLLMVLILAHFFAAHGSSIRPGDAGRSPLGLPRGSVRFLLLAGYLGLIFYLWHTKPNFEYPPQGEFLLLLAVMLTSFFAGHLLTAAVRAMSGGTLPAWFQDIQAWVALMALLALAVILVVQLFINPSLSLGTQIEMPTVEAILAGLVGFYFGARS
jgi:hypothetical protein